jgi:tripeptidyl-peptidase-1
MSFLFLVGLFFVQAALSVVIDRVVEPKGWIEVGRTDPNKEINLIFAIKQQNTDTLEKLLLEKSSPDSDEYGNWMTVSEVQSLVAPSEQSLAAVKLWLISNGFDETLITPITPNSDLIAVKTTTKNAESLLNCKYFDYKHSKQQNLQVSRVKMGTNYHVDTSVAEHLDFVTPTKRFPPVSTLKVRTSNLGIGAVTPTFLRKLYNVGDAVGKSSSNSEGVASFQDEYYSKTDLEAFWTKYDITPDKVTDVPANTTSGYGLEAELDTQYISSLGESVPLTVWYTKGYLDFDDALLNWATSVASDADAPYLFSVSYGQTETSAGLSYVNRLNNELAKIGSTGRTVFFAAGDSGAGGGCSISDDNKFEPDYPACSPYVTAVGGLHGGTAGSTPLGETVWVDGGGGFSNFVARQSWQETAVANYLKTNTKLPPAARYNSTGRGFPDIGAQAVDFDIIVEGSDVAVDGTSCASPTAGGIFALLNDLRFQNGMSPLGFANPLIYSLASEYSDAFNDVTSGYNEGCSGSVTEGFYAQTSWDAASGNGSPNYSALAKYVLETGRKTLKYGSRFQKKTNNN